MEDSVYDEKIKIFSILSSSQSINIEQRSQKGVGFKILCVNFFSVLSDFYTCAYVECTMVLSAQKLLSSNCFVNIQDGSWKQVQNQNFWEKIFSMIQKHLIKLS